LSFFEKKSGKARKENDDNCLFTGPGGRLTLMRGIPELAKIASEIFLSIFEKF
jgi:hypothetical protein